jgi:hypothetical protein
VITPSVDIEGRFLAVMKINLPEATSSPPAATADLPDETKRLIFSCRI